MVQDLAQIEKEVETTYSLSDAIREGKLNQVSGWGNGVTTACALTNAWASAQEKGYE